MYRGWTSTILRDAPFSALYFMFFTQFKNTTLFESKCDKFTIITNIFNTIVKYLHNIYIS